MPLPFFYTSPKTLKDPALLMFSRGIERHKWHDKRVNVFKGIERHKLKITHQARKSFKNKSGKDNTNNVVDMQSGIALEHETPTLSF